MTVPAPTAKDEPHAKATVAQRLAFYEAVTVPGILAPRGWHCIGANGSSGAVLYVTPDDAKLGNWIRGPVVEVDYITSENGSGMDEIAMVFAQVFPHQNAFLRRVRDRLGLQPNDYKLGSLPKDKLIVQTDRLVQFRTPANTEGLGTMNWIKPNEDPIDGVAILISKAPTLVTLNVRLPREMRDLTPVIISDLLVRQRRDAR